MELGRAHRLPRPKPSVRPILHQHNTKEEHHHYAATPAAECIRPCDPGDSQCTGQDCPNPRLDIDNISPQFRMGVYIAFVVLGFGAAYFIAHPLPRMLGIFVGINLLSSAATFLAVGLHLRRAGRLA